MRLDRIELADIGNPRLMAAGVIKLLSSVEFPLPVEDIARALEIRDIVSFDTDAFDGALLTDEAKSNCTILVRANSRPERKRFTIGHELGHYLMPLHIPGAGGFHCTPADMRKEESKGVRGPAAWEAEANTFSAELLMPPVHFKRSLRSHRDVSLEVLNTLAAQFGVSKVACGRRMTQLADDPCAVVVSKDGALEYVYRHADFPFVGLQSGMALPRDSMAISLHQAIGTVSSVEPTEPSGWRLPEKRGMEVYEQVMIQAGGWVLTLLTAELDDEDEDEDES